MRTLSFAATATATALAAATAGVGLLVTAPGAASADATKSSAYGAKVTVAGQEAVKQPYVASTDGSEKTVGGELPDNPVGIDGRVLAVTAGDDFAAVEIADLEVAPDRTQLPDEAQTLLTELQTGCTELATQLEAAGEPLPTELPAPLQTAVDELSAELGGVFGDDSPLGDSPTLADLEGFCDGFSADAPLVEAAVLNVECNGDVGTFELAGLTFLGQQIPTPAVPQDFQPLPSNPLVTITANQQTNNADGSFSIDGLDIDVAGGEAEVILANATCGEPIAAPAAETPAPPAAPAPAPVAGTAPVTG